MKAIAICYKPYLKPEEAMIYCNLGRTTLQKNASNTASLKTLMDILKEKILIFFCLQVQQNMARK
jgi:hypothetical protein